MQKLLKINFGLNQFWNLLEHETKNAKIDLKSILDRE